MTRENEFPPGDGGSKKKRRATIRDKLLTILVICAIAWWLGLFGLAKGAIYQGAEADGKSDLAFVVVIPQDMNVVVASGDLTVFLVNSGLDDVKVTKVVLEKNDSESCQLITQMPLTIKPGERELISAKNCLGRGAVAGGVFRSKVTVTGVTTIRSKLYSSREVFDIEELNDAEKMAKFTSQGSLTGFYKLQIIAQKNIIERMPVP
jgi:hypothetical protein